MSELTLLRILLLVSMAIGPFGTHRVLFASPPRRWPVLHVGALACAAVGMFSSASILCGAWLLFCATSFALFLYSRRASLRSPHVLAACVPFLFSNIAALWVVGGANGLFILGYDVHFSYYAALHGNVLGWILIGAFAILAERDEPRRTVYVVAVFTCFASFLLIAFGIDKLRALKPIGVIGLSVVIPIMQIVFLRVAWARNRAAFALGAVSVAGLVFTMILAWQNELALPVSSAIPGVRGMISVHGVLNTLVIAPCFLAAVAMALRADR
jgi:hypothetical protein